MKTASLLYGADRITVRLPDSATVLAGQHIPAIAVIPEGPYTMLKRTI